MCPFYPILFLTNGVDSTEVRKMTIGNIGKGSSFIRNLNEARQKEDKALGRLASGKRVNKASDDAAGLAIIDQLTAQSRTLGQAARNSSDTDSLLNIADGAVSQISNIETRLQELATQSANGTLSDDQRTALQTEFNALQQEARRIAETTEFNGVKPLASNSTVTAQVGTDSSANSQISVSGLSVQNALTQLESLDISSIENARTALDSLSSVSSSLSQTRGTIGAAQSRLETARENSSSQKVASEEAASRIRDADVADEAARSVAARIRGEAGTAILAQANQSRTQVLQLLS